MSYVRSFLHFWYDFIVGDDWVAAAGTVLALAATALLSERGFDVWWLMPAAVPALLAISIWRARQQGAGDA